jgi:hypothetical protein
MQMERYHSGKIYKLVNDVDDKIYIGSPCLSLAKRLYSHKTSAIRKPSQRVYAHLNVIGFSHVRIILIENWPCNSKNLLEARERHWIEQLKSELNTLTTARTVHERRQYNNVQASQYKARHCERVLEAQRIRKAARVTCAVCNTEMSYSSIIKHNSSKTHRKKLDAAREM